MLIASSLNLIKHTNRFEANQGKLFHLHVELMKAIGILDINICNIFSVNDIFTI